MTTNTLFKLISESFGLYGKTIKIVNTRRSSDGIHNISDINYTKDGKNILASYCDQHRDDADAFSIFEEVNKFEKVYGDGTSFLTMLLTYLTKASKVIPFSKEEIDRDIDYLIRLINNESSIFATAFSKCDVDLIFKNWLMTVCKSDPIYKSLFEFYRENPNANILSIKRTESFDKNEIIFKPRSGFTIASRIHSVYQNPAYNKYKDYRIAVMKNRLDSELFKALEEDSFKADKRLIVLCTEITDECETLINESRSERIIAIRYIPDQINNIYKDLGFMLNREPDSQGIIVGNIKEIKIEEDTITLYGFERSQEELKKYCDGLLEEFESTEDNDKEMLNVRISNIISDSTFYALINAKTLRRYRMLHGMIEDVIISKKHFGKGLIAGGMNYVNNINEEKASPIIKIVQEIHSLLHRNKQFVKIDVWKLDDMTKEDSECVPIDLKENTIQIFEVVRSYLHELAETSSESIITKSKWYGA